jgi:hypothetical protein
MRSRAPHRKAGGRRQEILHPLPRTLGQSRILQPHLDEKLAHLLGLRQAR